MRRQLSHGLLKDFSPSCPVCVDLDGTLVQHHTLWRPRGRFQMGLGHFPKAFLGSLTSFFSKDEGPFWFEDGKWLSQEADLSFEVRSLWCAFKWHLSRARSIEASQFAYNHPLFDQIRSWKEAGVPLYLVTGSPLSLARAVFVHTGLFTGFLSSSSTVNLVGRNKARALVHRWGVGGFHYVGDSWKDRHVWSVCDDILTAAPPSSSLFRRIICAKRPDQRVYTIE